MNDLKKLSDLGQSIWYDYIRRDFIIHGDLQSLINIGLKGITSNPSIFEKAIADSNDYDSNISALLDENLSVEAMYERLAFKDIALAADMFESVFTSTNGKDGFVSIEVDPNLAHDPVKTAEEAIRIFAFLHRSNIMIKVPGTEESLPVITELIANGVNVNITLLFNVDVYRKVAEAYVKGILLFIEKGGNPDNVNSVASFFVSRIDSAVDKELDKIGNKDLKGKIAIANAKKAYQVFREIFNSENWMKLEKLGAKKQRLLWASTSTKDPVYPDTLYIDYLIGQDTVNTVPPATLKDFIDHGKIELTLEKDTDKAIAQFNQLNDLNISLEKITDDLLNEGIEAFSKSFNNMLNAINNKMEKLRAEGKRFCFYLHEYHKNYTQALDTMQKERVIDRIWKKDHTVWSCKPDEITNRLGWLKSPGVSLAAIDEINDFVGSVRKDGFRHVLLMGMGGSSLAPEVFSLTFGAKKDYLDLFVIDSTDPGAVLEYSKKLDPTDTLYIVSTKSGGTVETFSFMKYFYNQALLRLGKEKAGDHFAAITDPGSGLQAVASHLKFRKTFLNDPDIGGRYSALSFFGIVPAALLGVDIKKLLTRAAVMQCSCESLGGNLYDDNTSARLGLIIGIMAQWGKDKLTFVISDKLASFGSWAEQLIAESTGKLGKGIVPVDGELIDTPEFYTNDRLFVYIKLTHNEQETMKNEQRIKALKDAGYPVIQIVLNDIYDLGAEFFRWEMATAVAGWCLNIQPFDQPNVESAKVLARKMVDEYKKEGKLPEFTPSFQQDNIKIFGDIKGQSLAEVLSNFFNDLKKGDESGKGRGYISLQAYLKPELGTFDFLQSIRTKLQEKYKAATTVGFGPRFLHSTGQLHKGDAGNGLFIQFISSANNDISIPDNPGHDMSSMTFGVLIKAQALGDKQALLDGKRKVITIDLGNNVIQNLKKIVQAIV